MQNIWCLIKYLWMEIKIGYHLQFYLCHEQIFDRFYADVSQSIWASVVNSILNSFTALPSVWSLFHCHINSCLILRKKILKYDSNHDFESSSFQGIILWFLKKIIFQHTIMAHETPPPLHGKCHLKSPYFPDWFEMMIRI